MKEYYKRYLENKIKEHEDHVKFTEKEIVWMKQAIEYLQPYRHYKQAKRALNKMSGDMEFWVIYSDYDYNRVSLRGYIEGNYREVNIPLRDEEMDVKTILARLDTKIENLESWLKESDFWKIYEDEYDFFEKLSDIVGDRDSIHYKICRGFNI